MINNMQEIEKYKLIYSNPQQYSNYGHSNHGSQSLDLILNLSISSIIDVGCGFNEFCNSIRKKLNIFCLGVDFACPGADIIANACDLPFNKKQFDLLTSFDMLEHLLPSEIETCLKEFNRVSKKFIFSISYRPSFITCKGYNLHPTVKQESWWIEKIQDAGCANVLKYKNYLYGDWIEK